MLSETSNYRNFNRSRASLLRYSPLIRPIALLVVFYGACLAQELASAEEKQTRPDNVLRILTLNVGHGRGSSTEPLGHPRETVEKHLNAIAAVLRRENPDVVALQEIDGPSFVSGSFDHLQHLRGAAGYPYSYHGWHFDEGIASVRFCYGTAILSYRTLTETHSQRFKANDINFKGFVTARIEFDGRPLTIVSAHMNSQSPEIRRKQAAELVDYVSKLKTPTIICGDLNSQWMNENDGVRLLSNALALRPFQADSSELSTYPAPQPSRRLDWILLPQELEFESCRALADHVSDHFGVIAAVRWKTQTR